MKDRRTAVIAALTAAAIIAQQIGSKSARDTLFLAYHDAADLPKVMLAASILALTSVTVLSRLFTRFGPGPVVAILFFLNAGVFVGEHVLHETAPELIGYLLYVQVALFGAALVSGFWSVVNERFDPHAAKKYVGRIGGGATAGGVLGGLLANRVADAFGTAPLLPVLAFLNLVAGLAILRLWSEARPTKGPAQREEPVSTLEVFAGSPYLRRIALLVVLLALAGAFLDFALKAEADASLTDEAKLAAFFSLYYTATSILTFLVQNLVSGRLLDRLGIGFTLAALPVLMGMFSTVAAASRSFWGVVLARGANAVLESSTHRSAYELLYTPVAPREKRAAKLFIDVAGNRLGDAAGSGVMILVIAAVGADVGVTVAVVGAAVAAGLCGFGIAEIYRGYIESLAKSLTSGNLVLDESLAVDATTRRTLAETTVALDRDKLLKEIEALREKQAEQPAVDVSADSLSLRRVLARPLEPGQIADVIPLLATNNATDVSRALRRAAPKHLGQIIDGMLDPTIDVRARRRLPSIVASATNRRAVEGLCAALEDPRFEIRYRSAQALSALAARRPNLTPPKEEILRLIGNEVSVGEKVWTSQVLLDEEVEDTGEHHPLEEAVKQRRDRSLEHVFNLLGIIHDRRTMRIAQQALASGDQELRGTALEWLENVLSEPLRRRLWPHVTKDQPAPPKSPDRSRHEIVDELLRSMQSLQLDREAVLAEIAQVKVLATRDEGSADSAGPAPEEAAEES